MSQSVIFIVFFTCFESLYTWDEGIGHFADLDANQVYEQIIHKDPSKASSRTLLSCFHA